MTLFEISTPGSVDPPGNTVDQPNDNATAEVKVVDTHLGKAVYSARPFPETSVIGEITGRIFDDQGVADDYTFEYDQQLLEPTAPFRFLNHSCAPNCEFDMLDIPATDDEPARRGLFLIAIANIFPGQELTIEYNWPASYAIKCLCQSPDCCGWIVAAEELSLLG